jgi:hypothetical protein
MVTFEGKHVAYTRFRKEQWTYRMTYHAYVRYKLVCFAGKEKCLSPGVKFMVGDIKDLNIVWETLIKEVHF